MDTKPHNLSIEQLRKLKHCLNLSRIQASRTSVYTNLDTFYNIHEDLRKTFGPEIIKQLDELE